MIFAIWYVESPFAESNCAVACERFVVARTAPPKATMKTAPGRFLIVEAERFLLVETTGRLWLLEQHGDEMIGRVTTRTELARLHPRLHAELVASDNENCPRVVMERLR